MNNKYPENAKKASDNIYYGKGYIIKECQGGEVIEWVFYIENKEIVKYSWMFPLTCAGNGC